MAQRLPPGVAAAATAAALLEPRADGRAVAVPHSALTALAEQAVASLRDRGVKAGEVVALAEDAASSRAVAHQLAAWQIGAAFIRVSAAWPAPQLRALLAGVRALVAPAQQAAALRRLLPRSAAVLVVEKESGPVVPGARDSSSSGSESESDGESEGGGESESGGSGSESDDESSEEGGTGSGGRADEAGGPSAAAVAAAAGPGKRPAGAVTAGQTNQASKRQRQLDGGRAGTAGGPEPDGAADDASAGAGEGSSDAPPRPLPLPPLPTSTAAAQALIRRVREARLLDAEERADV